MKIISQQYNKLLGGSNLLIEMNLHDFISFTKCYLDKYQIDITNSDFYFKEYEMLMNIIPLGYKTSPIKIGFVDQTLLFYAIDNTRVSVLFETFKHALIIDNYCIFWAYWSIYCNLKEDLDLLKPFFSMTIRIECFIGSSFNSILFEYCLSENKESKSQYLTSFLNTTLLSLKRHAILSDFDGIQYGFEAFLGIGDHVTIACQGIDVCRYLTRYGLNKNIYCDFIELYSCIIERFEQVFKDSDNIQSQELDWEVYSVSEDILRKPVANSIRELLGKDYVLYGFGKALHELVFGTYYHDYTKEKFKEVILQIEDLENNRDVFLKLLSNLRYIQDHAKRIKNSWKYYFWMFFTELFTYTSSSYLKIDISIEAAYHLSVKNNNYCVE